MIMDGHDGMTMSMDATATMSDMHMPSPTSDPMDMSHSSTMMGMDMMKMVFFSSSTTPLFSSAWTPDSPGKYAGTCIFLIIFAAIFRALLAVRFNLFDIVASIQRHRGDDQIALYATDKRSVIRPWRASEALMVASLDVVLAGVGYLLMIAVMTMNVGYFLSVLAGVFTGSLIFGRFMARSVQAH